MDARIAALVPLVYPLDPSAVFVYRQWPVSQFSTGCVADGPPTHGVVMTLWPDRATLVVDSLPLATQLRAVPAGLWLSRMAARVRTDRWTFTAEQCTGIPELYARGVTVHRNPAPSVGGTPGRAELVVRLDGTEQRYDTPDALNPYMSWLGAVWQELDRCAGSPWSTPR